MQGATPISAAIAVDQITGCLQSQLTPPLATTRYLSPESGNVMGILNYNCLRSTERHFFSAAVQFTTTVIGDNRSLAVERGVLNRNRPSLVTSYGLNPLTLHSNSAT